MPTDTNPTGQAIPQPTPIKQHRFHLLDALRGIAAILVVLYHAPAFYTRLYDFPNSFLAVDFFFCLSGFVVAFSYEDRLQTKMTFTDFSIVRLIRLYPLYALGTALGVLRAITVTHLLRKPALTVAALLGCAALLLPNLAARAHDALLYPFNHPAWSLFYELIANLVYALLIPGRFTRHILPVLCFTSIVALIVSGSPVGVGVDWGGFSLAFARVGFSFLAGALLFRLFAATPQGRLQGTLALAVSVLVSFLLLATLMLKTSWSNTRVYGLLMIAVVFPALVYVGARCTLPTRLAGTCAFLGDASYPLYMLHVPLSLKSVSVNSPPPLVLTQHASFVPFALPLYLALLVPLSWFIGRTFDLPVRKQLTTLYKGFLTPSPRIP